MENITPDMSKNEMAAGSIASRFISQDAVDEARDRREQQWKDAYARIGQAPPKQVEEADDGRTLFERLQSAKQANQDIWDERMKLSNQYRGLDAEEHKFLADTMAKKREEERKIAEADNAEIRDYREQLALRNAATLAASESTFPGSTGASSSTPSTSITSTSAPTASSSKPTPTSAPAAQPRVPVKAVKKDVKSMMKGLVVKKKPASAAGALTSGTKTTAGAGAGAGMIGTKGGSGVGEKRSGDDDEADAKKRKTT